MVEQTKMIHPHDPDERKTDEMRDLGRLFLLQGCAELALTTIGTSTSRLRMIAIAKTPSGKASMREVSEDIGVRTLARGWPTLVALDATG